MRKRIVFAIGDAGSAHYLLAVLARLNEEFEVTIIVAPGEVAEDIIAASGEKYFVGVDALVAVLPRTDYVFCGTAGAEKTQAFWRAVVLAAMELGVSVGWFGDFCGSGSEAAMRDFNPRHLALFDESSAGTFKFTHPDAKTKLTVVGNPSFDRFFSMDRDALRRVGRNKLGLTASARWVHYAASKMKQFDLEATLTPLSAWTSERNVHLSISFHPADRKASGEQVKKIEDQVRQRQVGGYLDAAMLTDDERLGAPDIFLTDYSTDGVKAAALGTPTAFLLFPSAQEYQKSRGGTFPFFPILKGEGVTPALGIFSPDSLFTQLDRLNEDEGYRQEMRSLLNLRHPIITDGQAGKRFVSFVEDAVE